MEEEGRSSNRGGRRPKRFLTPMRNWEIYLQVIRGEVTMVEAAAAAGVDRTDGGADPSAHSDQTRQTWHRAPKPGELLSPAG